MFKLTETGEWEFILQYTLNSTVIWGYVWEYNNIIYHFGGVGETGPNAILFQFDPVSLEVEIIGGLGVKEGLYNTTDNHGNFRPMWIGGR